MQFFDKKSTLLIVLFTLPLLFFPKINLVTFGAGETAGIRTDDFVLLLFSVLLFWAHFALRKTMYDIEKWVLYIVSFSLFSFCINQLLVAAEILHVNAKIFYAVRLLEYFLFFYVGLMASRFIGISTVYKLFLSWNILLMLLQRLQLVGMYTVDGYTDEVGDRVLGIASFGSEMGMVLNLVFCFLIYEEGAKSLIFRYFPKLIQRFLSYTYNYWMFLLFVYLVVQTGARMAIFALAVSFLLRIYEDIKWKSPRTLILPLVTIAAGCILGVAVIQKYTIIVKRSEGLLSFSNFGLIKTVWDVIPLDYDPIGRETVSMGNYDMSWWMRIHKWCYATKIYYLNPECWLQGVGPGFAMAGLDGGYLRILTETGMIGCFLYAMLFRTLYRQSRQLKWMMVVFLVNMVFFDVYIAYKPMSLLFLVAGYAYAQRAKDSREGVPALQPVLGP